jgi:hypothetical protein
MGYCLGLRTDKDKCTSKRKERKKKGRKKTMPAMEAAEVKVLKTSSAVLDWIELIAWV